MCRAGTWTPAACTAKIPSRGPTLLTRTGGLAAPVLEIQAGLSVRGSNAVAVTRVVLNLLAAGAATARPVTNNTKTISTPPQRTLRQPKDSFFNIA
jgi:hypothetical protein